MVHTPTSTCCLWCVQHHAIRCPDKSACSLTAYLMVHQGQIRCGLATVQHPMCNCDNCEGGGLAHTLAVSIIPPALCDPLTICYTT